MIDDKTIEGICRRLCEKRGERPDTVVYPAAWPPYQHLGGAFWSVPGEGYPLWMQYIPLVRDVIELCRPAVIENGDDDRIPMEFGAANDVNNWIDGYNACAAELAFQGDQP